MVEIPTIETVRLRLRSYRLDDFETYVAMWADPRVVRFIGGEAFTREQSWTRFLRHMGMWHYMGFGYFALEDKATGAFVGECGFQESRRDFTPPIEGTMEAGWSLIGPEQGKGLATEAVTAALGWAHTHGVGERITCIIDPQNAVSLRLAQKLGFAEYGRTTYHDKPIVLLARPR